MSTETVSRRLIQRHVPLASDLQSVRICLALSDAPACLLAGIFYESADGYRAITAFVYDVPTDTWLLSKGGRTEKRTRTLRTVSG